MKKMLATIFLITLFAFVAAAQAAEKHVKPQDGKTMHAKKSVLIVDDVNEEDPNWRDRAESRQLDKDAPKFLIPPGTEYRQSVIARKSFVFPAMVWTNKFPLAIVKTSVVTMVASTLVIFSFLTIIGLFTWGIMSRENRREMYRGNLYE